MSIRTVSGICLAATGALALAYVYHVVLLPGRLARRIWRLYE